MHRIVFIRCISCILFLLVQQTAVNATERSDMEPISSPPAKKSRSSVNSHFAWNDLNEDIKLISVFQHVPVQDRVHLAQVDRAHSQLIRTHFHPWTKEDVQQIEASCGKGKNNGEGISRITKQILRHFAGKPGYNQVTLEWRIMNTAVFQRARECAQILQTIQLKVRTIQSKLQQVEGMLSFALRLMYDVVPLDAVMQLMMQVPVTQLEVFNYKRMTYQNVQEMATALRNYPHLVTLDLSNSRFSIGAVQMLAEALKENSHLKSLNLNGCSIEAGGAFALADALKENKSLQEMQLFSNLIGADGARAIAEGLKENSSLLKLDLNENGIGSGGARALSGMMKENHALQVLQLVNNQIGDPGASAIADALKYNKGLLRLDLEENQIEVDGALSLADSLKSNTHLLELDMYANSIKSAGAQAFATALKHNHILSSLNLVGNGIEEDGALALADALGEDGNTSLLRLYVSNNPFNNPAVIDSIETALMRNFKIALANRDTRVMV